MLRHDPLSALAPEAELPPEPVPTRTLKGKGKPKLPPLLRELAAVADNTLAFLYGGADQQPGDYERNQLRAPEIRADFTLFCEQHAGCYGNWRQAWSAFIAARQPVCIPVIPFIAGPIFAPAPQPVPIWRASHHRA